MKIATWNVNSLRVRLPHVLDWLQQHSPDVLAIQECKLVDKDFPIADIQAAGYNAVFAGQAAYNGVAILAKQRIEAVVTDFLHWPDPQRRLLAATINGVRVINVYVPNGSEVGSEKFQYKLTWLQALSQYLQQELATHEKLVILGDFNIAPADADVYNPEALAGQVLVSPEERQQLQILLAHGLQDVFRLFTQPERIFSWWDYRNVAFRRNMGLRIDLILANAAMAAACKECNVDKAPRKLERPSDHAPVWAVFE